MKGHVFAAIALLVAASGLEARADSQWILSGEGNAPELQVEGVKVLSNEPLFTEAERRMLQGLGDSRSAGARRCA